MARTIDAPVHKIPTFPMGTQDCPLCRDTGGTLVCKNALLRVVLVADADLPGFARVIANEHVKETTDLDAKTRRALLDAVFAVEEVVRDVFNPLKMNVASLGNAVPHVHWHVIPRFSDDPFYPQPIWCARQRETPPEVLAQRTSMLPILRERLEEKIGRM